MESRLSQTTESRPMLTIDLLAAARRTRRSRLRHPSLLLGGFLVLTLLTAVVLADFLTPHSPLSTDPSSAFAGPSRLHPLGADEFGRDLWSRVLFGARVSLRVTLTSVGVALLCGSVGGVVAAYFGGWVNLVLTSLMDLVYGFPAILLTLVVISILTPSLGNAMIAITIIFIPLFARVARATALIELGKQYVEAAQAIGVPTWRVLSHHVGPNIAVPLIVQATAMMGYAITIEAALSFLGLGAQPPTPSWGSMLASGRDLLSSTPWVAIASGGSISLAVLGFNLLGDGLRDALDPVLKV